MNTETLITILLGLGTMLGLGFSSAIIKPALLKIGDKTSIVYQKFFTSIIFFILSLFYFSTIIFNWQYLIIAFLIGFFGYLPFAFFLKGMKVGKTGLIAPIANSSIIVTTLLSVLLFHDTLSTWQIIAIGIIFLGIITSSINLKDFKSSAVFNKTSGIQYALIACLGWGIVFSVYKIPVSYIGPILTAFITEFAIFLIALFSERKKLTKEKIITTFKQKEMKNIGYSALALGIGLFFYFRGIEHYSATIIYTLSAINPILILFYGKRVYNENINYQQYL